MLNHGLLLIPLHQHIYIARFQTTVQPTCIVNAATLFPTRDQKVVKHGAGQKRVLVDLDLVDWRISVQTPENKLAACVSGEEDGRTVKD